MITQPLPQGKPLDEDGNWNPEWQSFLTVLAQNLQVSLSEEGVVIPTQTTSNIDSLAPLSDSGTLLFDAETVNGGTASEPNGQLYVRLNDGTFRPITNL